MARSQLLFGRRNAVQLAIKCGPANLIEPTVGAGWAQTGPGGTPSPAARKLGATIPECKSVSVPP